MWAGSKRLILVALVVGIIASIGCQSRYDERIAEHDDRLSILEEQVGRLVDDSALLGPTKQPRVRVTLNRIVTTDAIGMTWDGRISATSGPGKPCPPKVVMAMTDGHITYGQLVATLREHCTGVKLGVQRRIDRNPPSHDATMAGFGYWIEEDSEDGIRVYKHPVTPTPVSVYPSPTP